MHCLRYFAAVGVIIVPVQAFAADPDNGERLAQRWCVACHVVTPAQTSTTTDQAPPSAPLSGDCENAKPRCR